MYVPTWVKHNKIPCRWMVYNKLQFLQWTSVVNCRTYICTYSEKMLVYVCLVPCVTRYITLFYIQRRTYAWLCASYKNGIREGQLRPILSRLKNVVFTFEVFSSSLFECIMNLLYLIRVVIILHHDVIPIKLVKYFDNSKFFTGKNKYQIFRF